MRLFQNFLIFILITAIGILYKRYEAKYFPDEELDKYSLVRKYLLNETEGIGGKPILWIHNTYDINARNWASYYSRNTKNLNQPYVYLCIESIIKHCGKSFNVCIIDDDSFEKLLKNWTINLNELSSPVRDNVRNLALSQLLFEYGGMLVPNTTLVMKDLIELYKSKIKTSDMFVGEFVNRNLTSTYSRFFPTHKFMGCKKMSNSMKEFIKHVEITISKDNSNASVIEGELDKFLYLLIKQQKCNLVCGKSLGVKSKEDEVILVDHWLQETPVKICMCSLYCICLPCLEILNRNKYAWFTRLNKKQILESNIDITKYILMSLGK
jgi:hypothetical protein